MSPRLFLRVLTLWSFNLAAVICSNAGVRRAHLEGGKGAEHVKGVHQLLVIRLAGTLSCFSSHLALLTLALLLQAGICVLNICTNQIWSEAGRRRHLKGVGVGGGGEMIDPALSEPNNWRNLAKKRKGVPTHKKINGKVRCNKHV